MGAPSEIPGRYCIIDRIGDGGAGVVYRVEDRSSGDILAMKVMPRARAGAGNLRGEFLALTRLRHDNIVAVFDYGLAGEDHDYFTMDLVEGPDLLEAARGLSEAETCTLCAGALAGLATVHARGMVHADIKPSNILVSGSMLAQDLLRAARLADFGLAADVSDPSACYARGTFPYAAPEVYAGRLDARSDLYALGATLYELCAGRKPFSGDSVKEVLDQQRKGPPPDPRNFRPQLSAGLAQLITALLDPAPGARPQTADEVLERINEVTGTSFHTAGEKLLPPVGGGHVGRERDLEALTELWQHAVDGAGAAALITGDEGIGKSRLLAELKLAIQLVGGRVCAIDVGAAGTGPHAGIAELLRGIAAVPTEDAGAALAPLIERFRTGGSHPRGRELPAVDNESRFALAEAVSRRLLEAAATTPMAILIDNLHAADPGTAEILAYVTRSVASAQLLVVLAGSDGSGAPATPVTTAHDAVSGHRHHLILRLPPLDRRAISLLCEDAFDEAVAAHIAGPVHRVSGGNPSHAITALEALCATGIIARRRGRWILTDDNPQIPLPARALDRARARADALSPTTRRVLELYAITGDEIGLDVLIEVATTDVPPIAVSAVEDALAEATAAYLIHTDAGAGRAHFTHRGIADELARAVSPDRRHRTHVAAAEILASRHKAGLPVPASALAHHHLAQGKIATGLPWALAAAEERAAAYDHHGAIAWYERILIAAPRSPEAASAREHAAHLHGVVGNARRARDLLETALAGCDDADDETRLRLTLKLAEIERQLGDGETSLARLMTALESARRAHLSVAEAQCHWQIARVLMYRAEYKTATEHAIAGDLVARAANADHIAADLTSIRADIELYRGDTDAALALLTTAEADAEGNDPLLAEILLRVGRAAIHGGDYPRAVDALTRAVPLNRRLGRVTKLARAENNLGAAYFFLGQWQKTRAHWESFRRTCERLGERSELVNAENNLGSLYRELGELDKALVSLDRGEALAAETGHAHMAAMIRGNRGEVLHRQGDIPGARACFTAAVSEFERIGAADDLIENRRRLCELEVSAGRVEVALDRLIDLAREAQSAGSRLEEGIIHRVCAGALRIQGDLDSATWFCDRAGEILATIGARYEQARLEMERIDIAIARGDTSEAVSRLDAVTNDFAEMGARIELARARERQARLSAARPAARDPGDVDLLVELSHASAILDIDRLLERALDKLLTLSHFGRAFILLLDQDGRPRERMRRLGPGSRSFAKDDAELSGSIVRRVAATGQSVAYTDIAAEEALKDQKSVIALGLKQVMCAPMRAHGRLIGVVYIDSRRLAAQRHGIDLAVLEAFAAHTALAVEAARLRAEEARKTELMAILAHEIRNPLGGILGYSEIGAADRSKISDEALLLFSRIHRDAQRLRRLVDNILELSRHEAGKVDWSLTSFSIDRLLEDGTASYRPVCAHKGIRLEVSCAEPNLAALGNPDRVLQVVANLLSNAVKFTPAGGVIRVTARRETVAGDDATIPPPFSEDAWAPVDATAEVERQVIRVDVSDTGPGMSEEIRESLFQKFAQGKARKSAGVGLGLYISREIIHRHGGTIWVDSEPGSGATFSFRIPQSTT